MRRRGAAAALRHNWPVPATLAAGLALTFGLTWGLIHASRERSARVFQADVAHLAARVEARMTAYASILAAGGGLFDASQHVERAEWRAFANALKLDHSFTGVQGIGFSERMPAALSLKEIESRIGAARDEPFTIRPDTPRPEVHAIVYLEPEDPRNRHAIGFDMYSEPVRRAAMDAAAAGPHMRISAPLNLVQEEVGSAVQPGILMFHPLYWKDRTLGSVSERRAALRGFVYAPFRMPDLMRAILGTAAPEFDFTLADRDAQAPSAGPLFAHSFARGQAADKPGWLAARQAIAVGGRAWQIDATAPPRYGAAADLWQELAAALAGVMLTGLAVVLVGFELRMRGRAEVLAAAMTQDLRLSRGRFERMMSGTTDGAWELDAGSGACYLSPRYMELLGFAPQEYNEMAGWVAKRVHHADRVTARQAYASMMRGEDSFDIRVRMRLKDASYRWFRVRGRCFTEADARIVAGSMSDVHAEKETQMREARLLQVLANSPDMIMTFDPQGTPTYVNAAVQRMFGDAASVHPGALAGACAQGVVDRLFEQAGASAGLKEFHERETELIIAGGRMLPVSQTILAHRNAGGAVEFYSTVMRDVTERRSSMAALMEAQERLQRALDGANDVIWECRVHSGEYYVSERLNQILGYPPGPHFNSFELWRAPIHPDDLDAHLRAVEAMYATLAPVVWDTRMRTSSGDYRWLRRRGRVVLAGAACSTMTAGTMTDIHAAKLAEEELKLHRDHLAQLVQERTAGFEAARLEAETERQRAEVALAAAVRANYSKSEFLANMSHELRTPMHAIISFANFGVEKHAQVATDRLLHYFRNIHKSGTRLLSLLNDLLDLSKFEAGKMLLNLAPGTVGDLLAEAIAEVEALALARHVRLICACAPGLPGVDWDATRMLQVLRNLLSNAIKFSLEGGCVEVSAHQAALPAGRRAGDSRVAGIEIRVRDAGIGIPEDELEAVFDKFVQSSKTKTGAGGTGLGLAICREIVLAHHGSIRAESNPGHRAGTTFVVSLALDGGQARRRQAAAVTSVVAGVEQG